MLIRVLFGILSILFSLNVDAARIRYVFTGTIKQIVNTDLSLNSPFGEGLYIGSSFTGFYEFNDEIQPYEGNACSISSQCRWEFVVPTYNFEVNFGSKVITTPDDYQIVQTRDLSGLNRDLYSVSSADYFDIGENWNSALQLSLWGPSGNFINDPRTFLTLDQLSAFEGGHLGIIRTLNGCSGCDGMIFGDIESISPVPLPSGLWLMATSLFGLSLFRFYSFKDK